MATGDVAGMGSLGGETPREGLVSGELPDRVEVRIGVERDPVTVAVIDRLGEGENDPDGDGDEEG
jgi:hypothetical protein